MTQKQVASVWVRITIGTPTRPEHRSPVCGYTTHSQTYKTRTQVASMWKHNTIGTRTRPEHRSPVRGYITQLYILYIFVNVQTQS